MPRSILPSLGSSVSPSSDEVTASILSVANPLAAVASLEEAVEDPLAPAQLDEEGDDVNVNDDDNVNDNDNVDNHDDVKEISIKMERVDWTELAADERHLNHHAAAAVAMEAAALAERAVGAVLMNSTNGPIAGQDEVALAAAAAAAVQATDAMTVVVDQALLATAAAAAASQVASAFGGDLSTQADDAEHDNLLEARRVKDRKRYASMSPTQRSTYNAHRRELYHRQGELARKRRRQRERSRYHSLEGEAKKERNARRAKLERERYQKLTKDELEARNARRRERAKMKKALAAKNGEENMEQPTTTTGEIMAHPSAVLGPWRKDERGPSLGETGTEHYQLEGIQINDHHHDVILEDAAMNAAAEVAEETIGAMMKENAVVVAAMVAAGKGSDADSSIRP